MPCRRVSQKHPFSSAFYFEVQFLFSLFGSLFHELTKAQNTDLSLGAIDKLPSLRDSVPTCPLTVTHCDLDLQFDPPISPSAVHQSVKESGRTGVDLTAVHSL